VTANRDKIIKLLSEEMNNNITLVHTFRSRIAFNAWIGPIIVLGSALVATHGALPLRVVDRGWVSGCAVVIVIGYLAIGYIAACIEVQALRQANRIREVIINLATCDDYEMTKEEYLDKVARKVMITTYIGAFFAVLACASALAVMAFYVGTRAEPGGDLATPAPPVSLSPQQSAPPVTPTTPPSLPAQPAAPPSAKK
jgi:hypothetical protein